MLRFLFVCLFRFNTLNVQHKLLLQFIDVWDYNVLGLRDDATGSHEGYKNARPVNPVPFFIDFSPTDDPKTACECGPPDRSVCYRAPEGDEQCFPRPGYIKNGTAFLGNFLTLLSHPIAGLP